MAYVLEMSNHKSNQNTNGHDDDNNSNISNSNQRMNVNSHYNGIANKNNNVNSNSDSFAVKRIQHQQHQLSKQQSQPLEMSQQNQHQQISKQLNGSNVDHITSHGDNKNYFNHFQFHNGEGGDDDDMERGNNPLNRGPFFDVSASKNVTALVGKSANLNCRIKNLGDKTVRIDFSSIIQIFFFFFSHFIIICYSHIADIYFLFEKII